MEEAEQHQANYFLLTAELNQDISLGTGGQIVAARMQLMANNELRSAGTCLEEAILWTVIGYYARNFATLL